MMPWLANCIGFYKEILINKVFDAISDPLVSLSYLGICPDLYKVRRDPSIMIHGPLEELDDETVNEFRGIDINIIN